MIVANILDPVHEHLDPTVWDDPASPTPKLKERHRKWIVNTIKHVLIEHGYDRPDSWLTLVLTGSLTTYQYSEHSDVDVSLFVDAESFPEWSRAEMIGVMVEVIDGKKLPGTTHPMQCFVVPPGVTKEMLYKPGLRSGYDLQTGTWIVPPEKHRVHDVQTEMNGAYVYALECADKMDRLLKFEPDQAVFYWHMLHRARRRDQQAGKGDFALSNIVYKFLDKKGLLPEIAQVSGEYIAKVSMPVGPDWLQRRIEFAGDPYAYHSAPAERHESIMEHGILPWDHHLNPGTLYSGGLTPRPGHAYMTLGEQGEESYGAYPKGHVQYRINLGMLDPAKISPDEDAMAQDELRPKLDTETYGEYADRIDYGGDIPTSERDIDDFASIAYRGIIPPEAIEVYHDQRNYRPPWAHGNKTGPTVDDIMNTPLAKVASDFFDRVHKMTLENGGATINLAGQTPTTGFAFAPHKHTEEVVPVDQFTPEHVKAYTEKYHQELRHPANHLGTWVDDGKVYLDVSQVHQDKITAFQRAHEADQLAMFDLSTFQEIPVRKTAAPIQNFDIDDNALEQARATLGLEHPVNITIVGGASGQYMGFDGTQHNINVVGWLKPDSANKQIWEELVHAMQYEHDPEGWQANMDSYWQVYDQGHDAYRNHPWELEAEEIASNPPFSVVTAPGVTSNKENSHGIIQAQGRWALEEALGR